ncbi:MAG: capsular biosynthesis protein [Bacteroidetes bacterium]|jgi:dTDP-4-amino-4,6-dideoxygalactose transaminase|nr:capsular biosynthesis protein [Bacteroidota bacterium]
MIPFSPPRIDDKICNEVVAALRSGWITTGPRTKEFEKKITAYCGNQATLCLNSATAGLEIMLRWFGVKEGDEVILPAYTYSATANVVIHCGATPVFVDVNEDDFNINVGNIEKAITPRTKVIMPVDFGGLPCDFEEIKGLVEKTRSIFKAESDIQKQLGRILVLSDAAHSFGATYKGRKTGSLCDVSVFSFHAVKNLTTAEGGAVALNLPAPFDNAEVYKYLCIKTLHGQNKDALTKTQKGNWRYDILEAGYKCNMTDLAAAIGLVEIARYDDDTLVRRKEIVDQYNKAFSEDKRFILPVFNTKNKTSCYHLYPLRIRNISEAQRDAVIQAIFDQDVSVNVHFIPVPSMSFYKKLGYDMKNYPQAFKNYACEITLPVYYDLNPELTATVIKAVINAVNKIS